MKRVGLGFLALCLWSAGCAGTETGNPSFDGTLGYDAYSSAPARVALRGAPERDQALFRIQSAWLVLGDVGLLGDDACDDQTGQGELGHAKGLGAGDHVGTQAPATHFELPASKLCGVRLPIAGKLEIPESAPDALVNRSILIEGTRDNVPFRIASAAKLDVVLRTDASDFEFDRAHAGLLIGFDVAAWFEWVDWSVVDPDETGTLILDDAHNQPQLAEFEARIAKGIALFRDSDGDGLLDRGSLPIAHPEE